MLDTGEERIKKTTLTKRKNRLWLLVTWKQWSKDIHLSFREQSIHFFIKRFYSCFWHVSNGGKLYGSLSNSSLPKPKKKNVYKSLNSFIPTLNFIQDCNQIREYKVLMRISSTFNTIFLAPSLQHVGEKKKKKRVLWEHKTFMRWKLYSEVATSYPSWRKVTPRWKENCQLGCANDLIIKVAHKLAEC